MTLSSAEVIAKSRGSEWVKMGLMATAGLSRSPNYLVWENVEGSRSKDNTLLSSRHNHLSGLGLIKCKGKGCQRPGDTMLAAFHL